MAQSRALRDCSFKPDTIVDDVEHQRIWSGNAKRDDDLTGSRAYRAPMKLAKGTPSDCRRDRMSRRPDAEHGQVICELGGFRRSF